ncbi:MAG: SDR family NAD(P)-dependent oxidoreductase, partial [Myxococcota bacterium]|nr:SDR family NAD(P)-dependent oxidoreductase [Myxococcota bacterium]
EQQAAELRSRHPIEIKTLDLDLREAELLGPLEPLVADLEVGLLVNNAGAAVMGPLVESDLEAQVDLIHLNCRAPLILAHHFGRAMTARGRGGIIFLSSTIATNGGPYLANYAATKAWSRALSEALTTELAPQGVDVQVLAPGMTRTEGLLASMDMDRSLVQPMEVEDVVRLSLDQLGRNAVVTPGWLNKASTLASRFLLPRTLRHRLMGAARPIKDPPG